MRTRPRSLCPGFVSFGAAFRSAALVATAFGFAAVAAVAAPAAPSIPRPERYVTDQAGVLPADRAAALNEKLAAFERQTSDQVLVYVDHRLPEGTTLEELAVGSLRAWGVGQKGKSNGVLFLVFTDDRKMRIEVGYGLEGALPDARAHRITDEIVKPRFRGGDFAGGIEAGADAILASVRGEPFVGSGKTAAESGARPKSRAPTPVFIVLALGFLGFWALMAFLIIRGIRRSPAAAAARNGGTRGGWTTGSGEWSAASLRSQEGWSSTFSTSDDSSSSSSSSDFSGGGGDAGGGGASDSW